MKKLLAVFLIFAFVLSAIPSAFADAAEPEYVTDTVTAVVRGDAGSSYAGMAASLLLLKGDLKPDQISSADDILAIDETVLDNEGKYEFEIGLNGIEFNDSLISDGHLFVRVGKDDITDTVITAYAETEKQFFLDMKIISDSEGRKAKLVVRSPENLTDDNIFLVVAQYSEANKLIGVITPDVSVANGGGEYIVSAVPQDDAKYCRVFVWYTDMLPLTKSYTVQKTPKNVLVIGNSFSVDSTRYVHKIAESLGVELNIYHYQHSGGSVNSLYEKRNGTTADSEWYYSYNYDQQNASSIAEGRNPTLDTFLDQNTLDAVVIQNYWAQDEAIAQYEQPDGFVPASGKKNHYASPNYVIMAKYIREKQPQAQIFINSIWSNEQGYYMANYVNGHFEENGFENESAFMYDLLEKYNGQSAIDVGAAVVDGRTIGFNGEPVTQLPVGYAIMYAKNQRDENGNRIFYTEKDPKDFFGWEGGKTYEAPAYEGKIRLHRDGFHLSQPGRFLAACVWVETLTGLDVRDSSFKPQKEDDTYVTQALDASGNTVDGKANYYYNDMDSDTAALIRRVAHEAVEKFASQGVRGLNDPSLKY